MRDELVAEQHAEHQRLAVDAGERRGAQVDQLVAAELEAELAVLRQAPLGHVHAREHLDARRERRRELERELRPAPTITPSMR